MVLATASSALCLLESIEKRIEMKSVVLILCGLLLVGFSLPASAASFDCAKVTLPAEKFVCANPFISGLDDKLDAVYRSVL
ncbi:MAG: hypothetical protein FWG62_04800, partial [Proteobacteria bacterium]|nr:hypothetical protein [Pseudomonadota bacterium]